MRTKINRNTALNESWREVLNEHISNNDIILQEDFWNSKVGQLAQKTDAGKTARSNWEKYKAEKANGTGNGKGNPIMTSIANGLGKMFYYANGGKGDYNGAPGGLFDKSTNTKNYYTNGKFDSAKAARAHDADKNAMVNRLQRGIQVLMTYAAAAKSLYDECQPTVFVKTDMKDKNGKVVGNGNFIFQLKMQSDAQNRNMWNVATTASGNSNDEYDKTSGFVQARQIRQWFVSPNQNEAVFRKNPNANPVKGFLQKYKNYAWLYQECGKLIKSTNIDFQLFSKLIIDISNRLNAIDIQINKICYDHQYKEMNKVKKDPEINALLEKKRDMVNGYFKDIVALIANKQDFALMVKTNNGNVNIMDYFFNLDKLAAFLSKLKEVTVARFSQRM